MQPPNRIEPMQPQPPKGGKSALVALLGVVAAAGLVYSVPKEESGGREHLNAYRDIVGVWTICDGDTRNVRPGMIETRDGCKARLEQQLLDHARPVMACSPRLREEGRDYQRWAAVSLAYNIGVGAYCRSSVDRNFDAGNWRAGCDSMLKWNKAGGRVIRGLALRRERERQICLRGLV